MKLNQKQSAEISQQVKKWIADAIKDAERVTGITWKQFCEYQKTLMGKNYEGN